MSPKRAVILNILASLVFAATIFITSALIADNADAQTITYLLIALWFIPFAYLGAKAVKQDTPK